MRQATPGPRVGQRFDIRMLARVRRTVGQIDRDKAEAVGQSEDVGQRFDTVSPPVRQLYHVDVGPRFDPGFNRLGRFARVSTG
eukprot:gene17028-23320_t